MCLTLVHDPDGTPNVTYKGLKLLAARDKTPWAQIEALLPRVFGAPVEAALLKRLDDFIANIGDIAMRRIETDGIIVRLVKDGPVHLYDSTRRSLGQFSVEDATKFLTKLDELQERIVRDGADKTREWFDELVRTTEGPPEKVYIQNDPPRSARGYCPQFPANQTFRGVGTVRIKMTGSRATDAEAANEAMKSILPAASWKLTPGEGKYVWHHLDDFDPVTLECTMQLVLKKRHGELSHSGSVNLWQTLFGVDYGRKAKKTKR